MDDITHPTPIPSGRFVLRLPPGLHAALREAAREEGVSLNDYCVRKLASPSGSGEKPAGEVVLRAASRFGGDLVGIVAFGSWARGEAADGSDVDVLVILKPRVPITRDLYRAWDEAPLSWGGRPVEAHFVHLPDPAEPPSGLWAEAALDGVLLFEKGFAVSQLLAAMRRRIAAGHVSRRRVHGQPYWVGGR